MPLFEYRATNRQGRDIKDVVEADSLKTARQKLKKNGLYLTSIQEQTTKGKKKAKGSVSVRGSVNVNDLAMMTRQLASLVKASVPLVESLTALIDQVDNEKLRVILADVRQKVNEGAPLSQSFGDHPKVFSDVYVNMVDAGETSGTLDLVLTRLANFLENQVRLRSTVTSGLMYPAIMVGAGGLIFIGIFTFVMPKIVKIFSQLKRELPPQTEFLIWLSNFFLDYWWVILIIAFVSWWIFKAWRRTEKGQMAWDRFLLRAPVFGKIVRMKNVAQFSSSLETMISSGVPLLTALGIVKNIITNVVIRQAVINAQANITEGQTISVPLKESGEFPPVVTHMIAIGEKTGELEKMLTTISESYEEQVKVQVERMTRLLEPIMILLMGVSVGFIVYSIVTPLMDMNRIK